MKRSEFVAALKAAGWLIKSEDFAYEVLEDGLAGGWTVSVAKQEEIPPLKASDRIRLTAEIAHIDGMGGTLAIARQETLMRVEEWESAA